MTVTIDATVGGSASNSYATRAQANAYFDAHLYSLKWTETSNTDKDVALVMATRLLDEWVTWEGSKVADDDDQALRWPRYGVETRDGYTFDSDVIPGFLSNATAELAQFLLKDDPTAEPDTKGFSEIVVDAIELKVDKADRDKTTVIPDSVASIIEPYGTVRSRKGSSVVTLLRA